MPDLPSVEHDDRGPLSARSRRRREADGLDRIDEVRGVEADHDPAAAVEGLEADRGTLAADRPFTIYADGDPIAELPATVSVSQRCLRVIASPK